MNAVIKRVGLSAAALVLLVTGPLFAQSTLTPEQLTLRVERLTELSQRSEAKLSTVQEQLKALSEDMSRMGRLVDNRAMLEMIQQVDQISEDINLLRGEIEVQGNDVVDIKKRQRELYQDIDRRLRDLESRGVGQAPAAQVTVPAASVPAQPAASEPSLAAASGAAIAAAPLTPTQAGEKEPSHCFNCGQELESGCPAGCGRPVTDSAVAKPPLVSAATAANISFDSRPAAAMIGLNLPTLDASSPNVVTPFLTAINASS